MEAKVRNHGEIAIISIQGPLEIEYTQPFKDACKRHFAGRKVIFNMEGTSFVGSTGIQPFLETIRQITGDCSHGLRIVGVKSEFRRIFQNLEVTNLEIHESEDAAIFSFDKIPGPIAA